MKTAPTDYNAALRGIPAQGEGWHSCLMKVVAAGRAHNIADETIRGDIIQATPGDRCKGDVT